MTLADLRRAVELLPPGTALTLSRDALAEALISAAGADAQPPQSAATDDQAWLSADEVAASLHVSKRWVYDHPKELGARHLSRRCVRFSAKVVARYMARAA